LGLPYKALSLSICSLGNDQLFAQTVATVLLICADRSRKAMDGPMFVKCCYDLCCALGGD
ncbi:MAG: hypothetical protein WCT03_02495, partial [Candidatus Obscuribacterales bacterium]